MAGRTADAGSTTPGRARWHIGLLGLALALGSTAATAARIDNASPQGEVAEVREVRLRFDVPVVRFGDPRLADPVLLGCTGLTRGQPDKSSPPAGSGRWVGAKDWVYQLQAPLPPGVRCEARRNPAWQPLDGSWSGPQGWRFATGGPAVLSAAPGEWQQIEEDQHFLLRLNGPAEPASIVAHAWCEVEGLGERIGVRVIDGAARDALLQARRLGAELAERSVLLTCQRPLPAGVGMRLVWGAGIAAANAPRVVGRAEQRFQWRVREAFSADFSCERERADAGCLPLKPLRLQFSAPVPRALAEQVRLQPLDRQGAPQGRALAPQLDSDDGDDSGTTRALRFNPPLPPETRWRLSLPAGLRDSSGRALANAASFPLDTATGTYPPLAKFSAAPFGILEWQPPAQAGKDGPAALPITLRHVQADLAGASAQGQVRQKRLDASTPDVELMRWIGRIERYHERALSAREAGLPERDWWTSEQITDASGKRRTVRQERQVGTRELSLLSREPGTTRFALPFETGASAAAGSDRSGASEVIGLPLAEPGYHVLELESRLLGRQLLDKPAPMYVRTGVLVTQLGVHFKRGRESSLIWVTSLERARPVANAEVAVNDCRGTPLWQGRTDAAGLARIPRGFEEDYDEHCLTQHGLFVSARQARPDGRTDLAFVFSRWARGIESWRFNQPTDTSGTPDLRAHTVFDRTLLRAGETVSMQHLLRRESATGLAALPAGDWPTKLRISHAGSGDEVSLPLAPPADGRGSVNSQWPIPADAKLGLYEVTLVRGERQWSAGSFRVEAFRVPLVDARLSLAGAPRGPLVAPKSLDLAVQLNYLAGGAVQRTDAQLSAALREHPLGFAGFEDYSFAPPRPRQQAQPADASDSAEDDGAAAERLRLVADRLPVRTDTHGAASVHLAALPAPERPTDLLAELTFADPNGEIQSVRQTVTLWPAASVVGLRARSWVGQRGRVQFQAVVLDTQGRPLAGRQVTVNARSVQLIASRKRVVGGFYAYDQREQVRDLGSVCSGSTDRGGLLLCDTRLDPSVSGEVELIARSADDAGRTALAATSVWLQQGQGWFAQDEDDRIDVLPEQRELAPGQTARLQVRMPFREATALVTVEREGVLDARLVTLRGDQPVIELPIPKGADGVASWAPNVYVGVLVLRGRVREVPWYSFFQWGWRAPAEWWNAYRNEGPDWQAPTGLVDLARPSYKFGVAALKIGLDAHRLDVQVTPAQSQYGVRQSVRTRIRVSQGGKPAASAEVTFAAVDEALLALQPNTSWELLAAMFQPRPWGVETATAQNELIGRRHYGRKALPAGGGGGRNPTRELFDTLLLWRPDVQLDANGEAVIDVPLNDSLTSFRLVAVASAGADRFGTGSASVRVSQDLQLLAGLPPLARGGDQLDIVYTLRNTTNRAMTVNATLQARPADAAPAGATSGSASNTASAAANPTGAALINPPPQRVQLPADGAAELHWRVDIPAGVAALGWEAAAEEVGAPAGGNPARDRLRVLQRIEPAVPLRVLQASLQQLDSRVDLAVAPPADALPASPPPGQAKPSGAAAPQGGLQVLLRPRLTGALPGIRRYFETYPWSCLEQKTSRAIGLRDPAAWQQLGAELPGYLDRDGLAQYFPAAPDSAAEGSDRLTAYLISAAHSAGWSWPAAAQERMLAGLRAFVEGRIERRFPAPQADLDVRKLAALEALSRHGRVEPRMLGSLAINPARWPSAALLDWLALLRRVEGIPERAARLDEAERLLRSRLSLGGTTLRFADEAGDAWWWLMDSADANAARLLLASLDDPAWRDDAPRLATGLVARLAGNRGGAFATTTANVWATLAFERFSAVLEATPVSGRSRASLGPASRELDWARSPQGDRFELPWPAPASQAGKAAASGAELSFGTFSASHSGGGKPWLALQSLAAVPLRAPVSAGYRIERSVTPIEPKTPGQLRRGDVLRVRLTIDAQADLGWVVVNDPLPAGASLLGSGLGRDSVLAGATAGGERSSGSAWLAYEERRTDAWRAYYRWLPRGRHTIEYTLRLNSAGRLQLPPTRVEAMYAPENHAEAPNAALEVAP